ncbi:MAG TPA: helix-turn-helix domain-containing protein [Steroidobacteraceae bacterium]|nr:helix-turn-helix domain-containing protein [Steroidobacteraceae bacterium]
MSAERAEIAVARVAAAIAEPARALMLYDLMDGRARTSTELAVIAEVSASTASVHLARLKELALVKVRAQGKYRYYSLDDERVAATLEWLMVLAGRRSRPFSPRTPTRLRLARTCYDHMAGEIAVALHDRLLENAWLAGSAHGDGGYQLTASGMRELARHGIDLEATGRRRPAYGCLDWSERRPHIGGALGAALLRTALQSGWVVKDPDSRALRVTRRGERALLDRFGVRTRSPEGPRSPEGRRALPLEGPR